MPLGPNFTGTGPLTKYWYRSIGSLSRYNFVAGTFYTMKLCSRRLLMLFVEISAKNDKFGHLNTIVGKLGVTHDLGWWLVGKPTVDFIFALIELSSLSVTVPELSGEMCTARLFSQGVDFFALKFYLDRSSTINRSWHQIPNGEDRIPLRSLVLTQHRNVTDGQTDGRTDMP